MEFQNGPPNGILKPIPKSKDIDGDYSMDSKCRARKYIIGYTGTLPSIVSYAVSTPKRVFTFQQFFHIPRLFLGFIPTLNFRYGKSYGRAADDSMCEFSSKQRKLEDTKNEMNQMFRTKSAPRMVPIRGKDEVDRALRVYTEQNRFKGNIYLQGVFKI